MNSSKELYSIQQSHYWDRSEPKTVCSTYSTHFSESKWKFGQYDLEAAETNISTAENSGEVRLEGDRIKY